MRQYLVRHRRKILCFTVVMAVMELLTVYSAVLNADLLNALVKGHLTLFLEKVGLLLVDWLFIVALNYWGSVYQERVIQDIDISIRQDLATNLIRRNYETYNAQATGVYESWINNDIQTINQQGLQVFFTIIPAILGTIFAIVTLVTYHWSLAIAAVALAAGIIEGPKAFNGAILRANRQLTHTNEAFVNRTQDALAGFNVLYTFRVLARLPQQIIAAAQELKAAYVHRAQAQAKILSTGFMGNVISQVLLIGLSGWLALHRIVSIGTLSAVGSLSGNIFNNLGSLSNNLGMMRGVRPIFDKFTAAQQPVPQVHLQLPVATTSTPILRVADLGFAFGKHTPVFEHVNAQFQQRKKYLILGDSGSGKSTFLRIIAGYYRHYTGSVAFAGRSLTAYSPDQLGKQLLYLDQQPQFFDTTVRDNLCLGQQFTDAELVQSLLAVRLIATPAQGPTFLATAVGQGGRKLSGGQLQRLALARGLLRRIRVILLDEGTSAVDTPTAVEIERLLLTNPALTLIMVSHTPHAATEKLFDDIIPFKDLAAH